MGKQQTIKAGIMTWSGRTLKEARAKQQKHLDVLFENYEKPPIHIAHKDRVHAIVWQSNGGDWSYAILHRVEHREPYLGCVSSGGWSQETALFRASRHVAQLVYDPDAEQDDSGSVIHPVDKDGQVDHAKWVRWQRVFASAKDDGANDSDARMTAHRASTGGER